MHDASPTDDLVTPHTVIVVGGSAGSVEALTELVRALPADLPAAVLITIHITPYADGRLPAILNRVGMLPASYAVHGEPLRSGQIRIAPPDHHLLVHDGRLVLHRGPRENRVRPAIDPLFRSVARMERAQVIGVVLSGNLGDGSAGALLLKAHGRTVLVQDPDEAAYPEMPRRTIRAAPVDGVLGIGPLAARLIELAQAGDECRETVMAADTTPIPTIDPLEPVITSNMEEQAHNERAGRLTPYSCPDCGGVLWQADDDRQVRFQCHVGHRSSAEVVLVQKAEALETALWSCLRLLTEKAMLTRQVAAQIRAQGGDVRAAERVEETARLDDHHHDLLRTTVLDASPNPVSQAHLIAEALATVLDGHR